MKVSQRFRELEANNIIDTHVKLAMGSGAIPIPLLDVAASSVVQIRMLKKLCHIYDIEFQEEQITAITSALASSISGKLAASAVKTIPIIGFVVAAPAQIALNGVVTYATGKGFVAYISTNKRIKSIKDFDVKDFSDKIKSHLNAGADYLKSNFSIKMSAKIKGALFDLGEEDFNEKTNPAQNKQKPKENLKNMDNDHKLTEAEFIRKALNTFDNDYQKYSVWMNTPNKLSNGKTPFQLKEEKKFEELFYWLQILSRFDVDYLNIKTENSEEKDG